MNPDDGKFPEWAQVPTTLNSQIQESLDELVAYRVEAKKASRSGNPALAAEGRKYLAKADDEIAQLKKMMSKEEES